MRALSIRIGIVLFLALLPRGEAMAQSTNPPRLLDMIRIEPTAGEPVPLVLATMDSVAVSQSYLVYRKIDMNGSTPTYTLVNLQSDMTAGYGLWGQASHGFQSVNPPTTGQYGFAAEVWPTTQAAQTAGLNYINSGRYLQTDFFLVRFGSGTYDVTALCVTPQFLARYFYSWGTLVYDVTCFSLQYANGFTGARTRLGYSNVCIDQGVPCNARVDEFNLFRSMNGDMGPNRRSVYQAMQYRCPGSSLSVFPGDNQFTVLSPTIDEGLSSIPPQINSRTTSNIYFDGDMDINIDPYYFVLGTPAVRAYNPHWVGSRQIEVTLVGRRQDWGQYGVVAYDHFANPTIIGARSDNGLIPLDGNGIGPNRDPKWWSVYSNYVDTNPAASVYGYTVTRSGSDVVIRWRASQEGATDKYLISVAPTMAGPFVQLSEVLPGSGSYMVTVPGGSDGIYNLVESDKNGERRDVCAEPVSATEPVPQDGSVTLTAEHFHRADSLLSKAETEKQQSRAESVWGLDQYRIFTLRRYQRPAEWLRNFWNSVGLPTQVLYVEDLGGPIGIQSYIDIHPEVTAGLIAADANEIRDAYGNAVLQNPAMWDTLGFGSMPGLPLQPELNQISMFYRVSPDSVAMAMPFWRRYYGSVVPYFDRNRNGKPDDGIRFGVAPVSDTTEFWGFAFKTANAYYQSTFQYQYDLWGYFRGGTSDEWRYALALLDSLQDDFSPYMYVHRLTDSFLNVMTTSQRQSEAISALNAGPLIVVTGSVFDDKYSLGKFFQADQGTRPSQLASNLGQLTAIFRGCGGSNYDETEDPAIGVPQSDPLLFTPDRGAYLIWGPNKGSDSKHNYTIVHQALQRIFADPWNPPPPRPFGDISNEVLCAVMASDPSITELAWSWTLLGDPNLRIKPPGPPVVGVGEQLLTPSLVVFPNPGRHVTVQFTLARPDNVSLEVYDIQGRQVTTLVSGQQPAGRQTVAWSGQNDRGSLLPNGVYLVRMRSSSFNSEQKVVWLQ